MMKLLLLLTQIALFGHDMWIEPATFFPVAGSIVAIKLRVGQELMGDPIPRSTSLIREFVVQSAGSRKPVIGREGADPAGLIRVESPAAAVVGYYSNPSSVEMPVEKFTQYLKEEGLDRRIAIRSQRPQKELFTRCAKALLNSGDGILNFQLELLAERNPYTLSPAEDLPVRLLYQNKPLAGALVVAMNRQHPEQKVTARTGATGRVRLRLHEPGMWMIKAVHMVPAPDLAVADWSSYWASLTFMTRTN